MQALTFVTKKKTQRLSKKNTATTNYVEYLDTYIWFYTNIDRN